MMCQSTHCSEVHANLSANAVECHLTTPQHQKNLTALSTRNTASGAIQTENSSTPALNSLSIFSVNICQTIISLLRKPEVTLKQSCLSSITGNSKKPLNTTVQRSFHQYFEGLIELYIDTILFAFESSSVLLKSPLEQS